MIQTIKSAQSYVGLLEIHVYKINLLITVKPLLTPTPP